MLRIAPAVFSFFGVLAALALSSPAAAQATATANSVATAEPTTPPLESAPSASSTDAAGDHATGDGESSVRAATHGPVQVLVMDLEAGDVDPGTARTLHDLVVVALGRVGGISVLSGDDVKRMMELSASKQAAGCDDGSCLTEVADALGARLVVFGRAGKLADKIVLNLSLLEVQATKAISRRTIEIGSLARAPAVLAVEVPVLMQPWFDGHPEAKSLGDGTNQEDKPLSWLPWSVVGAGAITTLVGTVVLGVSVLPFFRHTGLRDAVQNDQQAYSAATDSQTQQEMARQTQTDRAALDDNTQIWNGWGRVGAGLASGMIGVGVAALAGGTTWALWPGEEE